MNDLLTDASEWRVLLLAIVVFGLAPGITLRLIVRIYPKRHPRREELVAELYAITMAMRPFWVAQQFETALAEGIPARWQASRTAPKARRAGGGGTRQVTAIQLELLERQLAEVKKREMSKWFLMGVMSDRLPAIRAVQDHADEYRLAGGPLGRRRALRNVWLAAKEVGLSEIDAVIH